MGSPLSDVAKGYAGLAETLRERWCAHISKLSSAVEAEDYGVVEARRDLAGCAFLVAESWFLVAAEAVDAYATLTGRQDEPYVVDSEEFESTLPGAALALEGPLAGGYQDVLPVDRVTIVPVQLDLGATTFRLRVNATDRGGDMYIGRVIATAPGVDPQPIDVWIQIA
jgi:hypothetical protein